MMEELEALDKEAIEKQYVDSYKPPIGMRIMAGGCALILLAGMIAGGVYLFVCIIEKIAR